MHNKAGKIVRCRLILTSPSLGVKAGYTSQRKPTNASTHGPARVTP